MQTHLLDAAKLQLQHLVLQAVLSRWRNVRDISLGAWGHHDAVVQQRVLMHIGVDVPAGQPVPGLQFQRAQWVRYLSRLQTWGIQAHAVYSQDAIAGFTKLDAYTQPGHDFLAIVFVYYKPSRVSELLISACHKITVHLVFNAL